MNTANKMKTVVKSSLLAAAVSVGSLSMTGCGYNTLQTQDEAVEAAWSQVVNVYQSRADLVKQLIPVVERYAKQEKDVLTDVASARASAGSIQITPEMLNDPAAMKKFQEAQGQMSGALSRLLAVSERYPELKSDQLFLDLQAQIEGNERRIATERRNYIKAIQAYNGTVRKFPTNFTAMIFGHDKKANFSVENEAQLSQAPKVEFAGTATAAAQ